MKNSIAALTILTCLANTPCFADETHWTFEFDGKNCVARGDASSGTLTLKQVKNHDISMVSIVFKKTKLPNSGVASSSGHLKAFDDGTPYDVPLFGRASDNVFEEDMQSVYMQAALKGVEAQRRILVLFAPSPVSSKITASINLQKKDYNVEFTKADQSVARDFISCVGL